MIICNNGDDILEFEDLEDEDVEEGEGLPLQRERTRANRSPKDRGARVEWQVPAAVSEFGDLLEETSGVDSNVCWWCDCPLGRSLGTQHPRAARGTPAPRLRLGLKDL